MSRIKGRQQRYVRHSLTGKTMEILAWYHSAMESMYEEQERDAYRMDGAGKTWDEWFVPYDRVKLSNEEAMKAAMDRLRQEAEDSDSPYGYWYLVEEDNEL